LAKSEWGFRVGQVGKVAGGQCDAQEKAEPLKRRQLKGLSVESGSSIPWKEAECHGAKKDRKEGSWLKKQKKNGTQVAHVGYIDINTSRRQKKKKRERGGKARKN